MSRTLNASSCSTGQTAASNRPAHTPAATPHDTTRTTLLKTNGSLSHLKSTRLKQPVQSRNLLPEPLTPVATVRRGGVSTLRLTSALKSPAQTPLLTLKRDGKSRLPRATPAPTPHPHAALTVPNAGAKRVRAKKTHTLQAPSPIPAPSSSSSLTARSDPVDPSAFRNGPAEPPHDPDATPKKLLARPLNPNRTTLSTKQENQHLESKIPAPSTVTRVTSKTSIAFPSIIEELTPKRPMTRARSRQMLGRSTSSLSVSQDETEGATQLKRRPSRVMQLAQAFQQEAMTTDSNSSQSLLVVTPQRRASSASITSVLSPSGSFIGNSPNISALAASLSKQHVQRDRLSRARSAHSSVTDMLRYSTMSTLGGLQWEDGAGDVLLTDPNETEAMVADISMSRVTPLKPAVQSAAIALASARANFLNIVQENQAETAVQVHNNKAGNPHPDHDHPAHSPLTNSLRIKKRPSFGFGAASTPLSRSRMSMSSFSSSSPLGQVVAHESQLAALSASLEQSHQRELELKKEIQRLTKEHGSATLPAHRTGTTVVGKKLSDQERENSLVEEIRRLESELEECKEINIDLENSLDLVKFENHENLNKYLQLQEEHDQLLANLAPQAPSLPPSSLSVETSNRPSNPSSTINLSQQHDLNDPHTFPNFHAYSHELSSELSAIKNDLQLISFIKISLAINSDLFPS
ncbi:hypothetical protein PCASD_00100 [Puccinia coronata f. sp. avenae]|uniref:Uncharacterized protein n=1 Tax=Puccinia coronata f. sp. avenae TaxID=200324 RepID=A0A2N5VR28_9BASI|nr:hypothetical protein PCASD_00100 [Puccinia coronata f. sp. avenae]